MLSFIGLLFFVAAVPLLCSADTTPTFNGMWEMDVRDPSGCGDRMLAMIGVGAIQRAVILSLRVVEQFVVTSSTARIVRDTYYTHNDNTWQLGQTSDAQDPILGDVRQTVTLPQPTRLVTEITRPDGSRFSSVRHIRVDQGGQQFSNTMNFTAASGRSVSCVRFFTRISTVRSVGERVGTLLPVRPVTYSSAVRVTP